MSGCTQIGPAPVDQTAAAPTQQASRAKPSPGSVRADAVTTIDVRIKLPAATALPAASLAPTASPVLLLPASPTPTPTPRPTPTPTPVPTPTPTPTPAPIRVLQVTIAPPAKTALTTRDSLSLSAGISLSDPSAADQVVWSSDHPEIASVSEAGVVSSYQAGEVMITARSALDPTKQDSLSLQIANPVVHFSGQIVYLAKGNIWLMDGSNENPRQLTFDDEDIDKKFPRLSWDGDQVVFQRIGKKVYTVASSGDEEPVEHPLPTNQIDPLPYFSSDGKILFRAQGDPGYGSSRRIYQIDGDNQFSIFTDQIPSDLTMLGGVRPDGLSVYTANGSVVLSPFDDLSQSSTFGSGDEAKMAQNEDAGLIVYTFNGNVRTVSFAGQKNQLTSSSFYEAQAALSPDESKIVFISNQYGKYDLFMMNSDGTDVVDLTNTPDFDEVQPDWGH
ncbi:MAG: Ig-like domain-containing protein [Candidatus Sericytochromatia bacterium]